MNSVEYVFRESDYQATWNLTSQQLSKIGQLRAMVFCHELGWVGTALSGEEWDEFDATSSQIAVLNPLGDVVASVRVTTFEDPWMLDRVFRHLVPFERIAKRRDSAEASRLLVAREYRTKRLESGKRVCDLLYKAAYAYCQLRSIRYLYVVISQIVLRHFERSGLPCRLIAPLRKMRDGTVAGVAKLDWSRLHENSILGAWYDDGWDADAATDELTAPARVLSG